MDVDRSAIAAAASRALGLPEAIEGGSGWLDKYLLQTDPVVLAGIAELIAARLPTDTEVIAGVEVGGIGVAAALALRTGLPWSVARRGSGEIGISRVVGTPVSGRRTVMVKDGVLGGGSLPPFARSLAGLGAVVTHVAVGLSCRPDLEEVLAVRGVASIVALTMEDLRASW
ncbi:hypothetical protein P0W64_13415 [Tsukamurella sp. 8F]|uniref:hypothetical protein n=1 Tax=unclassified Tsukamurella TaxID=2633480 RepID=UPI0023B8BA12|nr:MULTISPECIES: hypothetical protein [unclassified Tsukamurella]MDF0530408.1 hypothetical protein [Tsukamurella sp. 8J]MDF0587771.1 hypothetical protein [Tsukamurella sp. 8F]